MLNNQGKEDLANSICDIGGTDAKFISIDQGDPKGLGHIGCAEDSIDDDEYFAVILKNI